MPASCSGWSAEGSSWNGSSDDYRTIKYEAGDGSPVWNVGYSGPADASDQALVVAPTTFTCFQADSYSQYGLTL